MELHHGSDARLKVDRSSRGDRPRGWLQKVVLLAAAATLTLAVFGSAIAVAGTGGGAPMTPVTLPLISGATTVGGSLSCSQGTWDPPASPDGVYTYQWNRSGGAISGATANTYLVTVEDVNQQITCTVGVTIYVGDFIIGSGEATSLPVTGQAPAPGDSTPGGGGGGGDSGTPPSGGSQPVALPAAGEVVELPSNSRCASKRKFRIRVRQIAGVTYLKVEVYVNGKKVKTVTGDRAIAPVNLRGLPKGTFAAKIVVTTTDGRTVSHSRKHKTCSKRRPGKKHPL